MPLDLIEKLTIISELYSSSSKTISTAHSSYKAQQAPDKIKTLTSSGHALMSASSATTHLITALQLASNTRVITDVALASTGLNLLLYLPEAAEKLASLGLDEPHESVAELNKKTKALAYRDVLSLQKSILLMGSKSLTKHDNVLRVLFNLPLEKIQDGSCKDIFPVLDKSLLKKKRGDAIKFYKKWLESNKQEQLLASFDKSLAQLDSQSMESPIISLFEVATYMSLLDPTKDQQEIKAFGSIFNNLLQRYHQTLHQDPLAASLQDETNQCLLQFIAAAYTNRAQRKHSNAKQLKTASHVLTGIGIVIGVGLTIHTLGVSAPAVAVLTAKLTSTSASLLNTMTKIAAMVEKGEAAESIAQLLTPEIISQLQKQDIASEFLSAMEQESKAYVKQLTVSIREMDGMISDCVSELRKIEDDPIYLVHQLKNEGLLEKIILDDDFIQDMNDLLCTGIQADHFFGAMQKKLHQDMPTNHVLSVVEQHKQGVLVLNQAKASLVYAISQSLLDPDNAMMAKIMTDKSKISQMLISKLKLQQGKAEQLVSQKQRLEEKYGLLQDNQEKLAEQKMLVKSTNNKIRMSKLDDSSTAKLFKATEYSDNIDASKAEIRALLDKCQDKLREIDAVKIISQASLGRMQGV